MVSARVFPWAKGLSETLFILLTLHDCCYSHIIAEDSKTQNVNKIKDKANHGAARTLVRLQGGWRGGGAAEVSTCSAGPHVLYLKPWMPWIGVVFHSVGVWLDWLIFTQFCCFQRPTSSRIELLLHWFLALTKTTGLDLGLTISLCLCISDLQVGRCTLAAHWRYFVPEEGAEVS